jgi:hypothetical protein
MNVVAGANFPKFYTVFLASSSEQFAVRAKRDPNGAEEAIHWRVNTSRAGSR